MDGRNMVKPVADSTRLAVHRRDHQHGSARDCCHPHAVEVVRLGHDAVAVCHDCREDSGFLPYREASDLADAHRQQTERTSVPLQRAD